MTTVEGLPPNVNTPVWAQGNVLSPGNFPVVTVTGNTQIDVTHLSISSPVIHAAQPPLVESTMAPQVERNVDPHQAFLNDLACQRAAVKQKTTAGAPSAATFSRARGSCGQNSAW